MYDTIVVGAGQAGLAIGYYLKLTKQNFVLIHKGNEVGESWKNRYDSCFIHSKNVRLFTWFGTKWGSSGVPNKGRNCKLSKEVC